MTPETLTEAPGNAGNSPTANTPPARPARRRRWLRGLLWALLLVVLLVLVLAVALWVWSGRDGSLATVLRLAGAQVPLVSENASGSVRRGGKVERLVWDKDGLHVEVHGATLLWQPMALLHGQLQIDELSATRILVRDERAPSQQPASGPPQSLALPLGIEVKSIAADEFVWSGPPEIQAGQLRGHYLYDRSAHQLVIDSLAVMDGSYQGRIKLGVLGKPDIDLDLKGVVASPMPNGQAALPVRAQAQITGPLESMQIKLNVAADATALAELPAATQTRLAEQQAEQGKSSGQDKSSGQAKTSKEAKSSEQGQTPTDQPSPALQAQAQLTPWQAPYLPTLSAQFQSLDLGAFLAQAPHTGLHGHIELQPLAPDAPIDEPDAKVSAPATSASSAASPSVSQSASASTEAANPTNPDDSSADAPKPALHWRVQAQVSNDLPGPLDAQRLPLNELHLDADWRDGLAVVRQLQARLAEGEINTQGQWRKPPNGTNEEGSITDPPMNDHRKGNDTAENKSEAPNLGKWRLVSRLSGINPHAIHSQLDAYPLDGELSASGEGARVVFETRINARAQRKQRKATHSPKAQAGALQALALQELQAQGAWTGRVLELERLLVRASEAELEGHGRFEPQAQGGQAVLGLALPGTKIKLDGHLFKDRGQGQLAVDVANLTRLHAWLRRLPGMPEAVNAAQAQGAASLKLNWRGGWAQPHVDARLQAPKLDWQPASASSESALGLRQLQLAVQGGLEKASLTLSGQALQGKRTAELKLQAQGGRSTPQRPLGESDWRAQVTQLDADLRDPQLGQGAWRVRLMQPVSAQWQAAHARQTPALQVSAGQISLSSPAPAQQALIAWEPLSWRNGQLASAGRITGLPLAWAEIAAADAMRQAGVSGNVIFNGSWNAQLGSQLKLQATLERASGDLSVVRKDPATGIESRIAAGLREARLTLRNEGERIKAQLHWDSAQLGNANGEINTRLTATRGENGHTQWAWPATAPLSGQLKLALPRVNAWSVIAPPGWRIHGSVNADLQIAGTRGQPQLSGNLGANDLAMRSVVDGLEFGGGRLRARLAGQRLLLDEFSLRGAGDQGGQLTATGEAGLIDGAPQARLAIRLQKLRASIRADRQVTVSGQVNAELQGKLTRVNGELAVDHALILLPEESAPKLGSDVVVRGAKGIATTRDEQTLATPSNMEQAADKAGAKADAKTSASADKADSALQVIADVKLNLGDDFRVRGMGIDTRLAGELTLAANGPITNMPRLTGDVRTVSGSFKAYNQNLNIQRGLIRFTRAIDNPTLDILAIRPNYSSEQRVGVQVQGTALLPAITLYSNPSLSETETLAWLLLGRAAPENGAEAAMLQSAAMAALGGREGKSLASIVGLDDLSFGSGSGSTSDASVTLGKRLSDNLYASYERSLSGVTGTLMIYLELSRRWTIRGQAGADNAVDLLFRLSYD